MVKVFLATHAHLASGFGSSLELFMGHMPHVTTYDAYVEGDESTLKERLDAFFASLEESDQALLLSDIYGGSVNTEMCQYLDRPNTRLVTGINLPFLIEVASEVNLTDERLDEIIQMGRSYMRRVELDDHVGGRQVAANTEQDFF